MNAEDRRAAATVGMPWMGPSVTPNATPDQEWRQQSGYSYSGILAGSAVITLYYWLRTA